MALGALTKDLGQGEVGSAPTFMILVSFLGDDNYPAGGTTGFEALVQGLTGLDDVDVIAVLGGDCGGYTPNYVRGTDALKVYESGADGSANDEVTATTDLSSVTFNVMVIAR